MVEEYISGKEATCGIIEDFRNAPFYSLLPVEITCQKNKYFHDYNSKYENLESRYRVPGNFTENEKEQIQETAGLVHKILGLRHYSRSDFIIHPKRGLFCLEVNTLPELTHRSSFVKSLEAVGGNIKEFLSHLLSKTLGK
jgi:D-alanine-D-alanine ligase